VTQITSDLKGKLRAQNYSAASKPVCTIVNGSYNPQVGQQSDTVTVTLTMQCVINYYNSSEAHDMALRFLQHDVGAQSALMDALTQVGQPIYKGTDPTTSIIKLAVPAAGVAVYQVSADELANMRNSIKGKTLKDARTSIAKQPGIDTQNIAIKVSYGDMVPADVQQIQIALANPANPPSVQLPAVQAVATPGT
jgi:hypothetical protein